MENKYASHAAVSKGEKTRALILDYVKEFIDEKGFPPTMTEIAKEIGVCTAHVSNQIHRLVSEGKLGIDYNAKGKRNLFLPTDRE